VTSIESFEGLENAGIMLAQMAHALLSDDPRLQQIVVPAQAVEKTRSQIGESDESVIVLDEGGAIVGFDEAATRLFGFPDRDVLGKDLSALLFVGDEGIPPAKIRAGRGGSPVLEIHPEVMGRRRSGAAVPLDLRVSTVSIEGRSRFLLQVRDRFERQQREAPVRRAEARYRALVEQIPAVTFMAALDDGDNEMYVSPQIEALLGFSQREWLDDPVLWFKRLHPDDQELWNQEFARGIASGGPFRAECRVLARDGHVVWILGEARLVRDDLGRPLFLQGIAFDITELKRAERHIRDAQETKIRNERLAAVGRLAASIGHDIRNPLAAIGNAYYYVNKRLAGTPLGSDPRILQFLGVMDKEIKACTRIVGDLLDYARERPPSLVACPLGPLVADAISIVPAPAHVALINDVPDTLPIPDLDKDQFRQILVNLIQNAAEAIPVTRAGRVVVSGHATDREIVLAVADNGTGIPEDDLDKIFEPLFTSKIKGTGLGLSIVSNNITRHGGTLGVETRKNLGTTFTIRLPRREHTSVPAPAPAVAT
jgi:PAS domain S-box-containing protein